jgi:hypothetical protein
VRTISASAPAGGTSSGTRSPLRLTYLLRYINCAPIARSLLRKSSSIGRTQSGAHANRSAVGLSAHNDSSVPRKASARCWRSWNSWDSVWARVSVSMLTRRLASVSRLVTRDV